MERFWLPVRASEHAGSLDQVNAILHWLMLVLFIGWGAFFLYTVFRFRASRNPKADYVGVKSHNSTYAEIAVAIIEVVILVGFSIPLWAMRVNQESFPAADKAVVVRVIGEQFAWNVHYPGADGKFGKQDVKLISSDNPLGIDRSDPTSKDDILTINDLHLPVGRPAIIEISSKDVIHSFALQQMRIKQDAIPGQRIPVWFVPTKTSAEIQEEMTRAVPTTGTKLVTGHVAMEDYEGIAKKGGKVDNAVLKQLADAGIKQARIAPATPTEITCAQLCGLGHYRMRGYYTVVSPADYDKWLKEKGEAAASGGGGGYE